MPQVPCPSCGRVVSVGDNLADAPVRCAACQAVLQTPTAVAAVPANATVQGTGFAGLEDDSPERQRLRGRARRAASAMYGAVIALIACPLIDVVLRMFLLGGVGDSAAALVVEPLLFFGFMAALLALPVTFMWVGGRCIARCSSAGLAVTGAIFAILAGFALGIESVTCVLAMAAGNWVWPIEGPLYLLGAATCVYAGIVGLAVATRADARQVFGRR